MSQTRRNMLKGLGFSLISVLNRPSDTNSADSSPGHQDQKNESATPAPPFASWPEAMAASSSHCFGIIADGQSKHRESSYTVDGKDADQLSFDISNNQILCNLTRSGLLREACIETGLLPIDLPDSGRLPTSRSAR